MAISIKEILSNTARNHHEGLRGFILELKSSAAKKRGVYPRVIVANAGGSSGAYVLGLQKGTVSNLHFDEKTGGFKSDLHKLFTIKYEEVADVSL